VRDPSVPFAAAPIRFGVAAFGRKPPFEIPAEVCGALRRYVGMGSTAAPAVVFDALVEHIPRCFQRGRWKPHARRVRSPQSSIPNWIQEKSSRPPSSDFGATSPPVAGLAMAAFQSARGLAHSKTLRVRQAAPHFRQVLDCGGPPPLFPGSITQSVFIRVHPLCSRPSRQVRG
jgi:hypothetical protein